MGIHSGDLRQYGRQMQNRRTLLIISGTILIMLLFLGACQRAEIGVTPTVTSSMSPSASLVVGETSYPTTEPSSVADTATSVSPTSEAYPHPIGTPTTSPYPPPGLPSPTISIIGSETPYPGPLASATEALQETVQIEKTDTIEAPTETATAGSTEAYPGPEYPPTITQPYPGPYVTPTQRPYPGPETPTSRPSSTSDGSKTPTITQRTAPVITTTGTPSSPTPQMSPPAVTVTPPGIPVELPPPKPESPPPAGSAVTIWHSWNNTESDMLNEIIRSFQRFYPDVTFALQYFPLDDLYDTFYQSAYLGTGPSLLLGPAEWGVKLFDSGLINDLSPYVTADFLADIIPAALASAEYNGKLISLPLSQHGEVMFRNTSIIDTAPQTFEELSSLSHEATRAGIVGTYLERGAFFSAADLYGLGGKMMDEQGYPAFDNNYGLQWLNLLRDYDVAGAVTFNTNLDLNMFKRGRVGIIIDGTWNTTSLQAAIGAENLSIDAWPTYASGHMSGWVQADSVFLNANCQEGDRFAALAFMGYLLDPSVQKALAEVGYIPSVSTTQPRSTLIQQAMAAFADGVPYPITFDNNWLQLYWSELNKAIKSVLVDGVSPESALKAASKTLNSEIYSLSTTP